MKRTLILLYYNYLKQQIVGPNKHSNTKKTKKKK